MDKINFYISSLPDFIKKNKLLVILIIVYVCVELFLLTLGVPNPSHPFPYHMDEWHQLMAIRAILKNGTTTISGSAEIPFLYPVTSGIYLSPFILFRYIDPSSFKNSIGSLLEQQKLFEVLRSVNMFYGLGSIFLIARILKKHFNSGYLLPTFLFIVNPVFILLSGFFKYDISLLFWIIFSIYLILNFGKDQTLKNYVCAAFISGLAMSTKFSAIPLFLILISSPFIYHKKQTDYGSIFAGVVTYIITFFIFGIPNAFIGKADYAELLDSNLVRGSNTMANYNLGGPWWLYLASKNYSAIFGHALYLVGIVSFLYLLVQVFKKNIKSIQRRKNLIFLLFSFLVFVGSLIPLKIGATGNRALVLLPFFVLFVSLSFDYLKKHAKGKLKIFMVFVLTIFICLQTIETVAWLYTRTKNDPLSESSLYMINNIRKGSLIGIENIPIYQALPNLVIREFYSSEYHLGTKNNYKYEVIDSKTKKLPSVIVISNADIESSVINVSSKNFLTDRLKKEGYIKIAEFTPDMTYYKIFFSDTDYYISGLTSLPRSITVFQKGNSM